MFATITSAINKKKIQDKEIEKISSWVFCRWLSGNPYTIQAANQINYYYNIPIKNQYYMIKNAFAGKIKYIPYPKNIQEDMNKDIEYLSTYFKISLEKAKEYLEFISEQELLMIRGLYAIKK